MISIIIPAHNEANSIASCLHALTEQGKKKSFEIIVVCNGCTDNTADIVKNFSKQIICLETNVASKTFALNFGESNASFFPRVYLDADINIDSDAVNEMCKTLSNDCLATSLVPKMNLSKSSWLVKAFYAIWLALPYCKEGMIGSGVYALSEKGRSKFSSFPDIIADDGFIRCLFRGNERQVTKGHFAIVTAPYNFFSLIKIKTRSRLGRYQLKDKFPDLLKNETKDYQGAFKDIFLNFNLWPKLIVYIGVNMISRLRAQYQYLTKQTEWERDESSRS